MTENVTHLICTMCENVMKLGLQTKIDGARGRIWDFSGC